jgi:hypothetical protein
MHGTHRVVFRCVPHKFIHGLQHVAHDKTSFKALYPNDSLECVPLGSETVIYSETKDSYFGVSGVAADILAVSQRLRRGLRVEDFIEEIANGRLLNAEDKKLVLDGVATLLNLGALYEK